MNVTVRNVVMSMSLMSAVDWTEFFESVSLVDAALRAAPSYEAMDFATRDGYRHAIEELARGAGRPELEVAREAIAVAEAADVDDARRRDPGFHLIGTGRQAFELARDYRAPPARRLLRSYVAAGAPGYFATIAVLVGVILAVRLFAAGVAGMGPVSLLLALLAVVPASDLAIALVNRGVTALVAPDPASARPA